MFNETVSFPAAFLAGLLSFFSPCVLPLIPAYFTFITGFSLDQLTKKCNTEIQKKVFVSTLFFVIGFSLIFILMGASASFVGNLVAGHAEIISIIGGIIIIILGVHLSGLLRIHFLEFDRHINIKKRPLHLLSPLIIGMAFGAGWSPCIGPLLGSILIIAGSEESVGEGILLLAIYSAGLAIPFLVMSCFINSLLVFMKKASKGIQFANKVAGILLILIGLYLSGSAFMNRFLITFL